MKTNFLLRGATALFILSLLAGGSPSFTYGLTGQGDENTLSSGMVESLNERLLARPANSELQALLYERQQMLVQLAKDNPEAFLRLMLIKKFRDQVPPDLLRYIEQEIASAEGVLEVIHVDDFTDHKNSRFDYFVTLRGERFQLYPTRPIEARSGTKIRLNGYRLQNVLVAKNDHIRILEVPPVESVGDQKTAVLLLTTINDRTRPFTKEQFRERVFNGNFQKFFVEQSYGKVSFSGDVYGWFDTEETSHSCRMIETADLVNTYKIDVSKYDRFVFMWTGTGGGCSWVGKIEDKTPDGKTVRFSSASVGLRDFDVPDALTPFSLGDSVLSHEMGHSLGLLHAHSLICPLDIVLRGPCRSEEYGNYFDVMGTGAFALHSNGAYKELLGWLPGRVLTISRSGEYTINPLEASTGKAFAKILAPTGKEIFTLEYRQPIGFDMSLGSDRFKSITEGILVHYAFSPYLQNDLLRLNQDGTKGYLAQPALAPGQVFSDPGSGVTIGPIKERATDHITFRVDIAPPQCARAQPALHLSDEKRVLRGKAASLHVIRTNTDSYFCPPSMFSIKNNFPASWKPSLELGKERVVLESGESHSNSFAITVPEDYAEETYDVIFSALRDDIHASSTGKSTGKMRLYITDPLKVTMSPTEGDPGDTVTFSGTGMGRVNEVEVVPFGNNVYYFTTRLEKPTGTKGNEKVSFQFPAVPAPGKYHVRFVARDPFIDPSFRQQEFFTFTIRGTPPDQPRVQIISPHAGATLIAETDHLIRWQADNVDRVALRLLNEKKEGIKDIVFGAEDQAKKEGVWKVPGDLGSYSLRIEGFKGGFLPVASAESGVFTVQSDIAVKSINTPTLALRYDTRQKELELLSSFGFTVTAPSGSAAVIPINGFFIELFDRQRNIFDGLSAVTVWKVSGAKTLGDSLIIPAGKTALIYLRGTIDPKKLFAGSYEARLHAFFYNNEFKKIWPSLNTNAVTIVGELSPYIDRYTPHVFGSNEIILQGVRFRKGINEVVVDEKVIEVPSSDGLTIRFRPADHDIALGMHKIYIRDRETGDSNEVYVHFVKEENAAVFGTRSPLRLVIRQALVAPTTKEGLLHAVSADESASRVSFPIDLVPLHLQLRPSLMVSSPKVQERSAHPFFPEGFEGGTARESTYVPSPQPERETEQPNLPSDVPVQPTKTLCSKWVVDENDPFRLEHQVTYECEAGE